MIITVDSWLMYFYIHVNTEMLWRCDTRGNQYKLVLLWK